MNEMVKDFNTGKIKPLQDRDPLPKPPGAADDCAYCARKRSCVSVGRLFFIGDAYPPCKSYVDYGQELDEDQKKYRRQRKLKKITVPVLRPEGEVPDCLYCKSLVEPWRCHLHNSGPHQGTGRICNLYNEVNMRPENAPPHCLFCMKNFNCTRGRVLRDGQPCKQYSEYKVG